MDCESVKLSVYRVGENGKTGKRVPSGISRVNRRVRTVPAGANEMRGRAWIKLQNQHRTNEQNLGRTSGVSAFAACYALGFKAKGEKSSDEGKRGFNSGSKKNKEDDEEEDEGEDEEGEDDGKDVHDGGEEEEEECEDSWKHIKK